MRYLTTYSIFLIFIMFTVHVSGQDYNKHENVTVVLPEYGIYPNEKVVQYTPKMKLSLPDTILSLGLGENRYAFFCHNSIVALSPFKDESTRLSSLLDNHISMMFIDKKGCIEAISSLRELVPDRISKNHKIHPNNLELSDLLDGFMRSHTLQGSMIEKYGFQVLILTVGENLGEIQCMLSEDFEPIDLNIKLTNLLFLIEKVNSSGRLTEELYVKSQQSVPKDKLK